MSQPIILYDIANNLHDMTVSRHVWRTRQDILLPSKYSHLLIHCCRLHLAYKRIPYETVWVEFGDIQKFAKDIGATPTEKNADGTDRYTFPIIRVRETGQVVSESFNISKYLDEKYPDRPLIPAGTEAQQSAFADSITGLVGMVSTYIPST
jgi:glutathione S-transferase